MSSSDVGVTGARFTIFFFFSSPIPVMVHLNHLNTFVKMREKYFRECCPLVQQEFWFLRSIFFFSTHSLTHKSVCVCEGNKNKSEILTCQN